MNPQDNLILSQLSQQAYQRFMTKLRLVSLNKREVLYESGSTLRTGVYFPVTAAISLLAHLPDGCVNELVSVNHEGMVVAGACCGTLSFDRAQVRTAGLAYRMEVPEFMAAIRNDEATMFDLVLWSQRRVRRMAQSLSCISHHSVEQRLAKYLLVDLDNTGVDTIECTHQEIADSLGVRRESVSLILKHLEDEQAIQLRRGTIGVLNRQALVDSVCECYEPPVKHALSQPALRATFNQPSMSLAGA